MQKSRTLPATFQTRRPGAHAGPTAVRESGQRDKEDLLSWGRGASMSLGRGHSDVEGAGPRQGRAWLGSCLAHQHQMDGKGLRRSPEATAGAKGSPVRASVWLRQSGGGRSDPATQRQMPQINAGRCVPSGPALPRLVCPWRQPSGQMFVTVTPGGRAWDPGGRSGWDPSPSKST